MSQYFAEGGIVKVKLGLSYFVTKTDFKNRTDLGGSKFAKKGWFSNLKIYCRSIRYW